MRPSDIRRTASAAKRLAEAPSNGTPEAFLLAWVAWEAFRFRVLAVGLAKQGWAMTAIKEFFLNSNLYYDRTYNRAFAKVFGRQPQQLRKEIASVWKACESCRALRHKFVHGMGSTNPDALARATDTLLSAVGDAQWISALTVRLDDGSRVLLGNIYAPIRPSKGKLKTSTPQIFTILEVQAKRRTDPE